LLDQLSSLFVSVTILSSIDKLCEQQVAKNPQGFELVKKSISEQQLTQWTELLKGLEPIHTDRETLQDWVKKYDAKIKGLSALNETVLRLAQETRTSRIFVVCCIRHLQQLSGLRVNYNTYKDSAIKTLTTLGGAKAMIVPPLPPKAYDKMWIPPIISDLELLSKRDESLVELHGPNLQAVFEDRLCDAFKLLGYEVRQLGHKVARREPDGIAMSRKDHYAILFDAKSSSDGYYVGTDDREIMEYIDHWEETLSEEGMSQVFFLIVSSQFKGDFQKSIRSIAYSKNVLLTLLKAEDLLYLLERRMKEPKLRPGILRWLFCEAGLLTRERIDELLSMHPP